MKLETLRGLAALAEAQKARDLARLEALAAEARRLETEIADLSGTHARDFQEGVMPLAMVARRMAWADAEIAVRQRRLGAIALEMAGVRAAARASVGKYEAIVALVARAEREERATRARSEEIAAFVARRRGA